MFKALALQISRLFGPFTVMTLVMLYLLLTNTGLTSQQQLTIAPILGVTFLVFPLGLLVYYKWRGRVSDLDLTRREERNQWLNWIVVSGWLGTIASFAFEPPQLYRSLLILSMVVLTTATLITFYKKISLHMTGATTTYLIINIIFDWRYWWLAVLLPMIAWARWYLKKHTPVQLLLGTALPVVIFLIIYIVVWKLRSHDLPDQLRRGF